MTRKLSWMLTAIVALAFGAQAGYTYDYTIEITNVNEQKTIPADLMAFLYDPDSGSSAAVIELTAANMVRPIAWNGDAEHGYSVTAGLNFTLETALTYPSENLHAVLQSKSMGYRQDIHVSTTGDTQYALGSNAQFQDVPEPTSGMLVFLGLAGLMLKRKRAA